MKPIPKSANLKNRNSQMNKDYKQSSTENFIDLSCFDFQERENEESSLCSSVSDQSQFVKHPRLMTTSKIS
jgi:hypothetical protein